MPLHSIPPPPPPPLLFFLHLLLLYIYFFLQLFIFLFILSLFFPTPFSLGSTHANAAMASKIPLPVVILVGLVSIIYLICSMVLLSSIIAWISLDFSPTLAGPLAFVTGTLSLAAAVVGILMEGVTRLRRGLGFLFLLLNVGTILTTIGLLVPFVLIYNGGSSDFIALFCDDCDQFGEKTQVCVDKCNDECCFTDMSEPLAVILTAFTGGSLLASVLGVGASVAHLVYAFKISSKGGKR